MNWEMSSYCLPLCISAFISAALAAYTWRRRNIPGASAFIVLMAAVAEWSFGYALELGSPSLPAKLFWARLEYLGIVTVPVAWLIFALQYSGVRKSLVRRILAPLAAIPALTFLLVWTNPLHGLIWNWVQLEKGIFHPVLSLRYGPWFWVHTVYSYLLILGGTLALIRFFLQAQGVYRQQVRTVLLAMFVPWVSNAVYIFGINPFPNLDLTPFAFTITGLLSAWGFLRLQFLDILPLAQGAILESMRDAVIVLDTWDRIVYCNPAADAITRRRISDEIGRSASQVFADYPDWVGRFQTAIDAHEVLVGGDPRAPQFIDLQISPLYDRLGRLTGRLIVLQDITEPELAKLALQKSYAELDRRVQQRTRELKSANLKLEREIIERKAVEKALRERGEMERLVSSISTNFIDRMVSEIDQEINRALQTIGEFAGVDRSYIFRLSADGTTITNTHEWCAPGTVPQKDNLIDIPCDSLPWWMGRLRRRETIHIPLYATLPQEARQEKEILRSKDIHSLVVVPLVYGKSLIGFLGFDSTQNEKTWAEEDIILLRLVGEIFASAIARKEAEEALRASDAELRAVFAAMNDQVLICDHTGRILKIAPTHPTSQYLPPEELAGKTLDEVLPADTAISILEHIQEALAAQKPSYVDYSMEIQGQRLWFSGAISPIREDRVVLVARDITERKASEEQLIYKALHDALTGLPNRRLFVERLERAFERTKRHPDELSAVLFMDLDGFKGINDRLGHPAGDRFLIEIAQRLRSGMRAADTVARLGGDEFALLLEEIHDIDEAIQVSERIQETVSAPVEIEGETVFSSGSIGIALVSSSYSHPEEILRDADTAMYRAKANGKGRYEVFEAVIAADRAAAQRLQSDLQRAIEQGEFQLFYQPVVDLRSGETTSVEALLRWRHPRLGLLLPGEFLGLAEEAHLISRIGEWVLQTACAQVKAWHEEGHHHLRVSVNTSPQQLREQNLLDLVTKVLDELDLDPRYLELEVPGQMAEQDLNGTIQTLDRLSQLGVNISIDDFGKGQSSLRDLKTLPMDILKMDRSFIQNHNGGREMARRVSEIISQAHTLNLPVIAKGIETSEQLAYAVTQGCDQIQGFLISRAIPAGSLAVFLRGRAAIPGYSVMARAS